MAGTYTITVLPAQNIFVLGFEPRISRVLGERHNQARPYEQVYGVSGFRSQYLVLAKHARFRLRQYPIGATPGGFEPPRAEPTHLAGEPLNHSGKVSKAWPRCLLPWAFPHFFFSKKFKKIKRLRNGESNPGHLRDRQRCYQLHHIGLVGQPPTRIELVTLRLLSACSAN